jgi:hypothetical protein
MFEQEVEREVAVYRSYRSWGQAIINDTLDQLLQRTPPPRLSFSLDAVHGHEGVLWADIAKGLFDDVIDSWAAELVQVTNVTRVYIAFHHEPENDVRRCGSPADFQSAYWYVRNRIEVVNAVPKLTWVIALMDSTFRGKHGGTTTWWPGGSRFGVPADQLVGVDLFNQGLCRSTSWRRFDWLAEKPYQFAAQVSRPLFVGACGCVEGDDCGGELPHGTAKGKWFDDALVYMRDTAPSLGFPPLEAFCYSDQGFRDADYRIDSSPEALSAFRALANDPFFSKPP